MQRQSLWRENRSVLRIHPWDPVPKCWREAYKNTQKLERGSRNAVGYMLEQKTSSHKTRKKRISFGNVIEHHIAYDADADDTLVIKKTAKESQISYVTAPAEMISGKFMEQWVFGLLNIPNNWGHFACGSRETLDATIAASSITKEALAKDMRTLWTRFLCKKIAILGYKSSWKMYPTFDETKWCALNRAWIKTGKKIERAPIFQKYLITVVQDPITATIVIQRQMRRALAKKDYSSVPQTSRETCKLRGTPSSVTAVTSCEHDPAQFKCTPPEPPPSSSESASSSK